MKKVVTCSQMKLLDHGTIHNMHVPSLVLMERAALPQQKRSGNIWKRKTVLEI